MISWLLLVVAVVVVNRVRGFPETALLSRVSARRLGQHWAAAQGYKY
jgi:hypothetical protein